MKQQIPAPAIIAQLKEQFLKQDNAFDFYVSQYISGDANKQLRKAIVKHVTGEDRPLSKCGMYAVADVLKNSFIQFNLFEAITTSPKDNHRKEVIIKDAYQHHTSLVNQTGIIVKVLPEGYNVYLNYFTFPNYNDQIYYYPFAAVEVLTTKTISHE